MVKVSGQRGPDPGKEVVPVTKTLNKPLTYAQERVVDLVQTTKVRKISYGDGTHKWVAYGDKVHGTTARVIEELIQQRVLVLRRTPVQLPTMNGTVDYWYLFVTEGRPG